MIMVNLDSAKNTFILESRENLKNLEDNLLLLEDTPEDMSIIESIFREAHTIKGSSGMFGYEAVTDFTHVFENLLDSLRKGEIKVNDKLIAISLKAHDHISVLIDEAEAGNATVSGDIEKKGSKVLNDMLSLLGKKTEDDSLKKEPIEKSDEPGPEENEETFSQNSIWHLSIRLKEELFKNGFDPFSFLSYLKSKGSFSNITTITEKIPLIDEINPENCYLGFEADFISDGPLNKTDILNIFEFIKDDSEIRIIPPNSKIEEFINLIDSLPEGNNKLGEILTASGTITKDELSSALNIQKEEFQNAKQLGEVLVDKNFIPQELLDAAIQKQEKNRGEDKKKKSIRIEAEKIDQLITLVGELVIASANIYQKATKINDSEVTESASEMVRLVDDIRDTTMNIRMVPIGDTFSTFKRTVHDMSLNLGKKIDLVISGGETELDKTLVEKIQDPLMHIIRNSIDHGIELPAERKVKGKKEQGTITLNAYHESGTVIIEVSDDGGGLSKEKIYKKAVEKGMIIEGSKLSDDEIWNIIFMPGFSTAEKITSVSGRGVGMDVVKKNVESLRGNIDIQTEKNKGTTFRIHLPLTLAIIDGFQVVVGGLPYVIPLDMVVECTSVNEGMFMGSEGGNFFTLRDEVLPFMDLKDLFRVVKNDLVKKDNMVIVEYAKKRAGLLVDSLLGELQTVIKPLGKLFTDLKWISGATILGNGDVALILDIPRLILYVQNKTN